MPFADSSGCRIYYEVSGTGAPLLLVAGQASDHFSWDGVHEGLAAYHRVIVYDHRGIGKSDKPTEPPYTTRMMAADAIAVLDDLRVDRAHAYGVSMGGRIGQWLGIDHGDRLGALVLCSTTPGDAHGVARDAEMSADMANFATDPAAQARITRTIYSAAWMAANRERLMAQLQRPVEPFAQALHFQCSQTHDAWDELPTIRNPTLVMHGSADRLNPTENAHLLASAIPGAELRLIQGGLHACSTERAAECNEIVLDFLARHPIPPPGGTRN
jgi:3-oxoadipate enol-lactonase